MLKRTKMFAGVVRIMRARQHTLLSVHCQSRLRFSFRDFCVACNHNNYDNNYFNDKDDNDICQREFNSNSRQA